jgi:hypothetical protein
MPTNLPYEEDFFQRIVNVNWTTAGVVFVCGGVKGDVHYIKVDKDPKNPQIISANLPGAAEIIGGSYGSKDAPAFVLMGVSGNHGDGLNSAPTTVVWRSTDGLKWSQVFNDVGSNVVPFSYPCAVTYDHDARSFFGALMNGGNPDTGEEATFYSRIISSQDGIGWAVVGGGLIGGDPSSYVSSFPSQHCKEHDCFDQLNQHVPGGIMSDKVEKPAISKIMMRPKGPPTILYGTGQFTFYAGTSGGSPDDSMLDDPFVGKNVEIFAPGGAGGSSVEIPCAVCFCVAGFGEIWLAGGWSAGDWTSAKGVLMYSSDAGKTWKVIGTAGSGIVCVSAAPLKDIVKSSKSR